MKVCDDIAAGSHSLAATASNGSLGSDSLSLPGGATAALPPNPDAEAQASAQEGKLTQALFGAAGQIVGSASSLIEVYSDRMRLSLRRKLAGAVIGLLAASCAVVWLGAAALATLRGVCGGFTALFGGRAWQGDLAGGLLTLALSALAIVIYQLFFARRELGRLKAKYQRIRNEQSKHQVS